MNEKKNIPDTRIEALGRLACNGPGRSAVPGSARHAAEPELERSIREAIEWYGAFFPDAGRMPAGTRSANGAGIKAGAITGARQVRSATGSPAVMPATSLQGAWLDLARAPSRIDTPTSALIAVLNLHGVDITRREHIFTVLDTNVHITPAFLAGLIGPELLDEASTLHANSHGVNSSRRASIQRHQDFAAALGKDRLQQRLFLPDNLTPGGRADGVYFDGNALVNAVGRSVDDLAGDPSLMRLPDFAGLTQAARRRMVVDWLDAHGQDTQYPFGTFEHSMASVLKTAALSRGEATPQPYASREALGAAFAALAQQWPSPDSTLIDPEILFGLHLVKTHGIELHGPASQRLDELKDCLNDLLTDAAGPPVFDRRAAALAMLSEQTGLSEEALTLARGPGHRSVLDRFMHFTEDLAVFNLPQSSYMPATFVIRTKSDGVPRQIELDAKLLAGQAEARFKAGLPHHPWFAAHARLELRRQNVPITADTVAEETGDLLAQYRLASEGPSGLRHWLDNMPVISNIIGIGEGIARGDADEIISSVPVISNIYNAAEGAATGDGKRTATALITLVPYVGSGYIIADGVASNDTAQIVGGTIGLGLDFVTEGEGHLLTRSRVVGHSALGEGRVAAHTFSHHEMPSAVRLQAQHSLGALRDLGMDDRALMLTDKAGEHGSVGDPFALVAAREEAAPSGAEMQQLLERLTPVPEDKRPVAMRRAEGGTWQDPQTLAHYAQIGAKLYRVAKDEAASSGGYVVWNPVDATGNARERTIRLENRDGQWQQARNAPGLKGGAPEPHRLPQLSADEVDNELANLDDRPHSGSPVDVAPQGRRADPAGTALVDWAHAEQARGLPLSHAEQKIHDSLNAPGHQQPAAPLPGSSRSKPQARFVPALPAHIDLLKDLPGELDHRYRSGVRRFLVHLEDAGTVMVATGARGQRSGCASCRA
ncbi:hypothetical protein ACFQVB_40475 [Paraburkholderia humisilvae]|uniref:hypothetical protein n=1 Tax=Paraburkholderia humisilvae TaxID=627669 RepID=UPI00360F1E25